MLNKIILFFATSMIFTSCYTPGTYKAMVASRDSLQIRSDSLYQVIGNKNLTIEDLQKKLASLKADLENIKLQLSTLQNNYKDLNENYNGLKSSATSETQDNLSKIENLQKELSDKENKINEINSKLKARENAMNALKAKLNDALVGFTGNGITVEIKNGKVYVSLSNQLLFKSGSTSIDNDGKKALLQLANELNKHTDLNILVEGHTDNVKVVNNPRFKDNWDLSVLRATEVTRYLTDDGGIDPTRVIASGRSEYLPIQEGDTPEIRAMNRRTEIILTPKLEELFEILGK